ncbi:FAD-dependent thymidylate synthase [Accumulibacter sp.]|uniref:FAD-dependent thymidylate synthase n=1 Tax=Accumulibacter sp. TaxID=2053492 RepID=UPI00258DC2A6|nr:FAD-dependent thymidylate synthase [Accumulibacter sp.]
MTDGLAPEQARMFLPQNMMTEWIWSGSLLAFMRICNLRLDSHTQKETQDVAKEIAFYLEKEFPESWGVYKRFNENI